MNLTNSVDIFNDLRQDDLCFVYSGSFFDSMTHKFIDLATHFIDSAGGFSKFKNKISFLMAECYQNVVRHGVNPDFGIEAGETKNAFFARSRKNSFFIASANVIANQTIDEIREKLERVNSLNTDELRTLQKQVLAQGKLSEKGGAGLGIIEMARRTGQKIEYEFEKINETSAIFYLMLKLKLNDESDPNTAPSTGSLGEVTRLHNIIMQNDILILHKGDFSENSVLPVIQMIEKNMPKNSDEKGSSKRLFHISVELLQNISMHALKDNGTNEALFILGRREKGFYVSTSNFVDNTHSEKLSQQIDHLGQLSKEELSELHRQKLLSVIDEKTLGAGIGLIYIFRKSKSIEHAFTHSGDISLCTVLVDI